MTRIGMASVDQTQQFLQERRRSPRQSVLLDLRWGCKEQGLAAMEAHLRDLSLHGCYIEAVTYPPEGSRISLAIQLPSGKWLSLRGEVIYCHPNVGFAIKFLCPSDIAQSVLAGLVSSLR